MREYNNYALFIFFFNETLNFINEKQVYSKTNLIPANSTNLILSNDILPYVRNPWFNGIGTSQTLQLFTNFYRLSNLFHEERANYSKHEIY